MNNLTPTDMKTAVEILKSKIIEQCTDDYKENFEFYEDACMQAMEEHRLQFDDDIRAQYYEDKIEAMQMTIDILYKESIEKEDKWHTQFHKPPKDLDREVEATISVLLYSPSLKIYSIGWFDFELDKWMHIADEEMKDFVWRLLPLPLTPKEL